MSTSYKTLVVVLCTLMTSMFMLLNINQQMKMDHIILVLYVYAIDNINTEQIFNVCYDSQYYYWTYW